MAGLALAGIGGMAPADAAASVEQVEVWRMYVRIETTSGAQTNVNVPWSSTAPPIAVDVDDAQAAADFPLNQQRLPSGATAERFAAAAADFMQADPARYELARLVELRWVQRVEGDATTLPIASTTTTTTTTTTTSTQSVDVTSTTLAPAERPAWLDWWRPTCRDVSVAFGPSKFRYHPVTGDYCDQRCRMLVILTRFSCLAEAMAWIANELPNGWSQVAPQLSQLEAARTEFFTENSGRELNQGGDWDFGPTYELENTGKIGKKFRAAVKSSGKQVPAWLQDFLDVGPTRLSYRQPTWALYEGAPWYRQTQTRHRAILTARIPPGCRPLTDRQLLLLAEAQRLHTIGGQGAALMVVHAALEATARDEGELSLLTIPAFSLTTDPRWPAEDVAALNDWIDEQYDGWADALRECHTDPKRFRALAWEKGDLHAGGHLLRALYTYGVLRIRVACGDPTLDGCPNLAYPWAPERG